MIEIFINKNKEIKKVVDSLRLLLLMKNCGMENFLRSFLLFKYRKKFFFYFCIYIYRQQYLIDY